MGKKNDWNCQFWRMVEYANGLGFEILLDSDEEDRVDFDETTIYIKSRNHPETKFYTLLHEIGHAEIFVNSSRKFEEDHPMFYQYSDGRVERSYAYRVSIVAEEIEAWRVGRNIARNLKLFIDDEKYDKHMTASLMTYINWASDQ